jgi:signal transduction histidine kinase
MVIFKNRSLRARLVFLSSGILLVALLAVWFGLSELFEKHVEQRIHAELTNHLNQLIVSVKEPAPGKFNMRKPLSDPKFRQPFSGLYWQVSSNQGVVLKSRSLWDFDINVTPVLHATDGLQEYTIKGPENSDLFSVGQNVILDGGSGETLLLMTIGLDHKEISRAVESFSYDLGLTLTALALVLILAVLIQVSVGLLPLKQMQKEITELQEGERQNLTGSYPDEIMPVVEEINSFVSAQEIAAERGRARAGDLAHGFKTPLSILSAEARRLERAGQHHSTTVLRQQISIMKQHVERELARAKLQSIQPRASKKANILSEINQLIAIIDHMPTKAPVDWNLEIPEDLFVQMDSGDFKEVCGNLLENARKWASHNINISARLSSKNRIVFEIEDDGPGVRESQLDEILQRGKRLDETTQGTGLGLAIANDIMIAYNFHLEPYQGRIGGLGMRLFMTAAKN